MILLRNYEMNIIGSCQDNIQYNENYNHKVFEFSNRINIYENQQLLPNVLRIHLKANWHQRFSRRKTTNTLVTYVTQAGNLEQVGNYCHLADMKNDLLIILLRAINDCKVFVFWPLQFMVSRLAICFIGIFNFILGLIIKFDANVHLSYLK